MTYSNAMCRLLMFGLVTASAANALAQDRVNEINQWVAHCHTDEITDKTNCAAAYRPSGTDDVLAVGPVAGQGDGFWINTRADLPTLGDIFVRVDRFPPHSCGAYAHVIGGCQNGSDLITEMLKGQTLHVRYALANDQQVDYDVPLSDFPAAYERYQGSASTQQPAAPMTGEGAGLPPYAGPGATQR